MRFVFLIFFVLVTGQDGQSVQGGQSGQSPEESAEAERGKKEDPLIERFEKIERKVVAWNDRFGMDPSRKDRITRKISNTMKMLIEKSRKAAASECRKVKNKNQVPD